MLSLLFELCEQQISFLSAGFKSANITDVDQTSSTKPGLITVIQCRGLVFLVSTVRCHQHVMSLYRPRNNDVGQNMRKL